MTNNTGPQGQKLAPCPKCGSPTRLERPSDWALRTWSTEPEWVVCTRSDELVEDCPGERRKADRRTPTQEEGEKYDDAMSRRTWLHPTQEEGDEDAELRGFLACWFAHVDGDEGPDENTVYDALGTIHTDKARRVAPTPPSAEVEALEPDSVLWSRIDVAAHGLAAAIDKPWAYRKEANIREACRALRAKGGAT